WFDAGSAKCGTTGKRRQSTSFLPKTELPTALATRTFINPRSRQVAPGPLLDGGWQAIPCNRQIGSEPDHNIRLEIWLLGEHRCRVSCMAEHFELAFTICRKRDQFLCGCRSVFIFTLATPRIGTLGEFLDV